MAKFVLIFTLVSLTTLSFVVLQTLATSCVLDISYSSSWNDSNCEADNWDGFIKSCCSVVFDDYLYALARRAKQNQKLFLNSTEQKDCLISMKNMEKDVSKCGIEKLTSGIGGCSDYGVEDVVDNLGDSLKKLDEVCGLLGSDQACKTCFNRWEEIISSWNTLLGKSKEVESGICSLSVLVTLISNRTGDKNWTQDLYKCLVDNDSSTAQLFLHPEEQERPYKHHLKIGIWILACGLVGISLMLCVAAWILCNKKRQKNQLTGKEESNDSMSKETSCLKISIKEIYSATNDFNECNCIGQGVAGKVYKGMLSNGQHFAVKHIIKDGYMDTFIREVRSVSHIKHPNLVALLGYSEGIDECFLVYELCCNGNISEWLFGKDKFLTWVQRLEIAIDTAKGLLFLHTRPEGCIVHRDIKPTNILLNAKFEAKLSDFGLSKVMEMDQSCVVSEVRGTFGYVDPEYRKNHHVNASGDVYSFGIVLFQLLSGQRVINMNVSRPMPINKMARMITAGGSIQEFADPRLNGEYSIEAFDHIFKLALSCTGIKQHRPAMDQVLVRLEHAFNISTQFKSLN